MDVPTVAVDLALTVGQLVRSGLQNFGDDEWPPWEGPFVIAKVLKPETYKLANSQGEVYGNAWNIQQLRRFYP